MDKKGKKSKRKLRQNARSDSTGKRKRLTPRQSARRRKLHTWLLYSFMILAVVGMGIALSLTVLFKIETVEVVGETRYSEKEITKNSGIIVGQNLFLCKAKEGGNMIEQNLPYIEKAQVSRKIPGKIVIYVTEAKPAGIIDYSGHYVVVNGYGKVLEYADQRIADLPVIKGIELSDARLAHSVVYQNENAKQILQDIVTAIQKNNLQNITEIDLTKLSSPSLNYNNHITIKLGLPSDLDYKIRALITALQDPTVEKTNCIIDLSTAADDNKFSVKYTASGTANNVSASSTTSSSVSSSVSSAAASSAVTSAVGTDSSASTSR